MDAHIEWSKGFQSRMESAFKPGGDLQKTVDSMILKSIEPYLPKQSGALVTSGKMHTRVGSGRLVWKTPYVRYLYYGILYVDPVYGKGAFHDPVTGRFWSRKGVKKIPSGKPLKFHAPGGGPPGKRGAFWAERWKRDNLTQFEKNLQQEANKLLHR